MKLCWIHPTTSNDALTPLWEKLDGVIRPILRDETELEFRFLEKSGNFVRSLYAEHINSVHIVEAAMKAEADGFDGIFLGCWNDPLWEAREILSIPVGSVSEQSMLSALPMGRRFAVITVSHKTSIAIENDLKAYGLESRAIMRPVRTIEPESDAKLILSAVKDPYTDFIPRLEEVARDCIRDGAEVILIGCAYYGPLLRAAGYINIPGTGVMVLDSSSVALKQVETMVDIHNSMGFLKSERLNLRAPAREALDGARRSLSLI